jgi:hypothetical protein
MMVIAQPVKKRGRLGDFLHVGGKGAEGAEEAGGKSWHNELGHG